MKNLYLFLNKHMKAVAVIWALCLLPIKFVPAFGWVVVAAVIALCVLMYVGDYLTGWFDEL